MLRPGRFLSIGLLAAVLAPRATRCQSRTSASATVVPLRSGRNAVDLLGTGKRGTIDVADRENYNAHGHHIAVFQVHAPRDAGNPTSAIEWQVVPFFDGTGNASEEIFHTVEGADCMLRDLRVLRGAPGKAVTVVVAEREIGRSYSDSAAVQFEYYALRTNSAGTVGYPSYYFARTRVVEAARPYCDVDDAFDRELHLGRTGLLRWEGAR